jgi:hypothetical protein
VKMLATSLAGLRPEARRVGGSCCRSPQILPLCNLSATVGLMWGWGRFWRHDLAPDTMNPLQLQGIREWAYTDSNWGPLPCEPDPPRFGRTAADHGGPRSLQLQGLRLVVAVGRTAANGGERRITREIRAMDRPRCG